MNALYSGQVQPEQVKALATEVAIIRLEFGRLRPADAVWDYERRDAPPPWGANTCATITTLADYWVTSAGMTLLDVLDWGVQRAAKAGGDITVV